MTEFVEKPGPDADRHQPDQRRRVHPRARACSTACRPPGRTSRSSATCSRRSSAAGLYGYEASGYWLDIGTPERYLQGDLRHPRGQGQRPRSAGGSQRRRADARRRRRRSRAAIVAPGAGRRRLLGRDRRALVGDRSVLGEGVTVGEGARVECSVLLDGRAASAPARRSARRSSGPGVHDRRALPDRGRRRARRGRQDRVGQHACGRRAYLPGRGAARRSDQVLSTTRGSQLARRSRRSTAARQLDDILGAARSAPRRAVAGRVGEPRAR